MTHNYGEIIPDDIVDTFYKQIKRCIDNNLSYDMYIKNIIKLNGKIPYKIQELIKNNNEIMEQITKYSDYELNESIVEVDINENGAYILTIEDIETIIERFTFKKIDREEILNELEKFEFIKVESAEIKELNELEPQPLIEEEPELIVQEDKPIKKFGEV